MPHNQAGPFLRNNLELLLQLCTRDVLKKRVHDGTAYHDETEK